MMTAPNSPTDRTVQLIAVAQNAIMKYPYFTEHEAMKIAQAVVAALPASEKKGGKVLAALLTWCQVERGKLGAVDGYNYKSGEEYGIRRVELQIERVMLIAKEEGK